VRPSAAVTGDAGHEAAARRDTTPDRLRRRLRGDLDAIVMMALRKEPNRRYASADLLAREIERHLVGRPVMAHKGSRVYAARKFVRRHAASVATAAAAFCSVVGGAAVALWQGAEARRERDRAELALSQAEVVTDFLVALFEAGDPLEARGDSVTARELLRRGALRIDALATDPIVKANLLEAMARVETNLGHAREAGALLER